MGILDADLSGIDRLILLADEAQRHDDDDFAGQMLAAHTLVTDMLAKKGDRISWGVRYLEETRRDALDAVRRFADVDATNVGAVLECQRAVRDYMRVAGFIDRLLRETASAVTGPEDDDPRDGVGNNAEAERGDA